MCNPLGASEGTAAAVGHDGAMSKVALCHLQLYTMEEGSVQGTSVQSRTENDRSDQENGLLYEQK